MPDPANTIKLSASVRLTQMRNPMVYYNALTCLDSSETSFLRFAINFCFDAPGFD